MSNDQAFEIVKQLCERVPLAAADNEIMRQAVEVIRSLVHDTMKDDRKDE